MQLFYAPDFIPESPLLPAEEAQHFIKVLRKSVGEELWITDGKGNLFQTQLQSTNIKAATLKILNTKTDYQKRDYKIHLAIAPTKNIDRTEWCVEKAVEIGVDVISFLLCERSERKHLNTERIEKIVISAMKQSGKAYLPEINTLEKFTDFLHRENLESQRFIAYLPESPPPMLSSVLVKQSDYCVLIGAEGDFSTHEVKTAIEKGFQPVSLGSSRLRTETAGVVAVHTLHLLQEC
jgi:16S rRNA (uracil1498-N3)-methyltransferase